MSLLEVRLADQTAPYQTGLVEDRLNCQLMLLIASLDIQAGPDVSRQQNGAV
jgi:hypothetical protein